MDTQEKPKPNFRRLFLVLIILAALFIGFFLYKSGSFGIGNSCSDLRSRYESAKEKEDYGEVSKYYQKMNDLGCE